MTTYQGTIQTLTPDGDGAFVDARGCTVSIPGTLPGETVQYRIAHVSPHEKRVWAVSCGLMTPSPERQKPRCETCYPVNGLCGGCPIMHMSAKLQASFKKDIVLNALRSAGINYIHDLEYHEAPAPFGYRNRTDLVVGLAQGRPILGSYEPRSHRIIPTRHCPILRQPLNQVMDAVTRLIAKEHIPVYEFGRMMRGALRYISFFANDAGDVLVDFVVSSDERATPNWVMRFANDLKNTFSRIKGVSFSINDTVNNAIRIAPSQILWGERTLDEHYGSLITKLSASGFTQLNSDIAAQIYRTARDWFERPARVVWDLYCGAGAFGRTMAPSSALYGAEFSTTAIDTAKQLAQTDPWQSQYEVMDLEKQWPNWPKPDVILLDPPRKGLSQLVIDHLAKHNDTDIFYMSCNPESFAKNLAKLDPNYEILRIAAFDMMPQTRHVEVLAHLKHR